MYWIRNIAYNASGGAARLSGGSGILFYNNTIFSEITCGITSNTHSRINVILGQNSVSGFGRRLHRPQQCSASALSRTTHPPTTMHSGRIRGPPTRSSGIRRRRVLQHPDRLCPFVNVPKLDGHDVKTVQKLTRRRILISGLSQAPQPWIAAWSFQT